MEFFPFEEESGAGVNATSDLLFKFDDDNYVLLVDSPPPSAPDYANASGSGGLLGPSSAAAAAASAAAAAAAFGVSANGSTFDGEDNTTWGGFENGYPFDYDANETFIILRGGNGTDGVGYYPSGYSLPHIILASIVVTMLMIVVVVGNMLVIIAIATEKALKNIQNWFIASLAVADFFLGLVIMPFSLANELMGYWIFGAWWCDIHSAADVLLCTASIMNLCLISLDRYWSITQAVDYLKRRTPLRAAIMIAVVWVMSGLICIPPLLGWKVNRPEKEQYPKCQNLYLSLSPLALLAASGRTRPFPFAAKNKFSDYNAALTSVGTGAMDKGSANVGHSRESPGADILWTDVPSAALKPADRADSAD
ncbi:alpha-2C adrenergic receptor-like [Ischnura elegans]|uniref:alpha-2C adrenergic receptor-like n=1 Tax=Ischnura elegans TaxID=197161 RepID=UPI001ED87341|nr:alpha-2C adrenergic receptor-like [Ischnura elegans]